MNQQMIRPNFSRRLKSLLCLCVFANASAGAADVAPAAKISTDDFFRKAGYHGALISPGGQYLAVLVADHDNTKLGVIDLANMKISAVYSVDRKEIIYHFDWVNNDRLVFDTVVNDGPLNEPYLTGHVFAADAKQGNDFRLGGADYEFIFSTIPDNPKDILITSGGGSVYTQNVYNSILNEICSVSNAYEFLADHNGKVRLASSTDDKDNQITSYLDKADSSWKELNRSQKSGGMLDPLAFAADNQHVFVKSDVDAPTKGLFEIDPESGDKKLIFRDDHVDMGHLLFGPDQKEPVGLVYSPDYPTYKFFDKGGAIASRYAALQDAFPDEFVEITNYSKDGRYGVVYAESDVDPGQYSLLDLKENKLTLLFKERPWIDPHQMASMTAITVKARDGLELRGYLTVPKGAAPRQLPLVVLPHGGPELRDAWGFDQEVQFLAYHGYAVLQINFRGSSGYGRIFEQAGYKHWGTTMQDDVTDATRWAIDHGVADPKRICIYGASYGGYAALMGVIREPDLYQCAIGYAGVYDLAVEIQSSDTADTPDGRAFLKKMHGDDTDDLKARSPVYNVDRIKVPLLLIHGKEDKRVPIKNLNELTDALDKAGKHYESLVKNYEGHGFYDDANNVEAYDRMLKFLDQNIGPDRAKAAPVATAATP